MCKELSHVNTKSTTYWENGQDTSTNYLQKKTSKWPRNIYSVLSRFNSVQPFATPWTVSYHNKRKWGKMFKVRLFYLLRFLTGNSRIHSTYLCKKCCFGIIEKTWVTRCWLSLQEKSPKTIWQYWYHPQIAVWQYPIARLATVL